jgi:hypothetical protein
MRPRYSWVEAARSKYPCRKRLDVRQSKSDINPACDMETVQDTVLPYRTDGDELARWLEARARGRTPAQIRALDFGAKAYDGTLTGAQALGLVEPAGTELTEAGRAYALAAPGRRPELLRAAMSAFEPYGLLLEAVFARGAVEETETAWIESWWATHGYGASATNRAEGAVAFARLADAAGLGSYVQGRRGHPSRLQWARRAPTAGTAWGDLWSTVAPAAPQAVAPTSSATATRASAPAAAPAATPPTEPHISASSPAAEISESRIAAEHAPEPVAGSGAYSSATIDLGRGRVATLRVPAVVSAAEKSRLLELFELLLATREA